MAGKVKHMERSHRSYRNKADFGIFKAHAFKTHKLKVERQQRQSLLAKLFHRNQDK